MGSPREGFGRGLVEAAKNNPRVVGLCADLRDSLCMNEFAGQFPERFVEVGVAEQNLVGVASGMAAAGKIPFAGSYAVFSPGRNWEQIRTTICYNNLPVKIISSHVGVSVGPDGATHQALEDIALMRVLPNMVVVSPVDMEEAYKATLAIAKDPRPCYLRLPRIEVPVITNKETIFQLGKGEILREGGSVTVIATGTMISKALEAAQELEKHNISVRVINIHTIKPLDERLILRAAEETGALVTAEEHQIAGGLGSAVAEVVGQKFPVPVGIVGVDNRFGQSGSAEELMKEYDLTVERIIQSVTTVLRMK
ncbi:MAG: transketolase family protein [Armatimonadetes bacterium]|nr:MAG: transketolase family protein [Armatimonadota bacterium]